jgi:hypothetical protein
MISPETTERSVNRLGTLKYFPVRPSVVAEVGRMLGDMCSTDDEANVLVDALIEDFNEWPGPSKMREFRGLNQRVRNVFRD